MCYNCGRPRPEEVIYLKENLFRRTWPNIACPDEGLIEVGIDDMRKWLVDRQALVRMLAAALEAAERETRVWREYPLERLGLADGTRPTAEGQVLLDFLRSGGKLERRPNDMPLLRLSQRMREWAGVADGSFSYSDRKSLWIALFHRASRRH